MGKSTYEHTLVDGDAAWREGVAASIERIREILRENHRPHSFDVVESLERLRDGKSEPFDADDALREWAHENGWVRVGDDTPPWHWSREDDPTGSLGQVGMEALYGRAMAKAEASRRNEEK